jgi:hypothetical protein
MKMTKESVGPSKENPAPLAKKPYNSPHVTDFGHISALTAGTVGSLLDEGHLANPHGH